MSMDLYAEKGERIYCEDGHLVATVARDLLSGDVVSPDMLEGIEIPSLGPVPGCPQCGKPFGVGYYTADDEPITAGFYFSDGFRLLRNGQRKTYLKAPEQI